MMKCIDKDKIDVGAGPRACPDFTKGNHRGLPLQKELPEGWRWATLDKACLIIQGQSPESSTYNDKGKGVPFFQGKAEFGELYPSPVKWCTSPKKKALKGDILISVRAPVGPTNIAPFECCIGRGLAALRSRDGIDIKYILYNLRGQINEIVNMGTGSTFTAINGAQLKGIEIPLAPLDQQTRIVSEIEKQFSRLDEAVVALKRVRASLKRYKASVLKAAVEGKLTEEWRKQNPNVEPADKLLKRILAEKKKKWEEKNLGKKYKEPISPDTSNLPELPEGWVWVNFMHLASPDKNSIKRGPFGSAIKKAFFVRKGYKVYEQQNAIYNNPKLGNYYIGEEKYNELIGFTVISGDFIISCSGTIGKIALIPEGAEKGIINQALLKISIDSKLVSSKYFLYLFKSEDFQKSFLKDTRGTAMKNIASVEDLKLIPVALPPLHEQIAIVEEIESRLSVTEEVEEAIDINLKRAERLRQAILKKAFSGRLVSLV